MAACFAVVSGGDAVIQATALDVALPVRCVVDNTSTDWPELVIANYYAYPPGGATLTSELPAGHFVEQRKPFALPSTPLTLSDPSVTHTGWGNNLGLGENTTINGSAGFSMRVLAKVLLSSMTLIFLQVRL